MPARILRSFLKQPNGPNIPIQAIGLSLYETLPSSITHSTHASSNNLKGLKGEGGSENGSLLADEKDDGVVETPGTKVTRTQWLDLSSLGSMTDLVGKNVLIVDEVDDTRTTLEYAVRELEKDVESARERLAKETKAEDVPRAKFSIFVLHVSLDFSHHTVVRSSAPLPMPI